MDTNQNCEIVNPPNHLAALLVQAGAPLRVAQPPVRRERHETLISEGLALASVDLLRDCLGEARPADQIVFRVGQAERRDEPVSNALSTLAELGQYMIREGQTAAREGQTAADVKAGLPLITSSPSWGGRHRDLDTEGVTLLLLDADGCGDLRGLREILTTEQIAHVWAESVSCDVPQGVHKYHVVIPLAAPVVPPVDPSEPSEDPEELAQQETARSRAVKSWKDRVWVPAYCRVIGLLRGLDQSMSADMDWHMSNPLQPHYVARRLPGFAPRKVSYQGGRTLDMHALMARLGVDAPQAQAVPAPAPASPAPAPVKAEPTPTVAHSERLRRALAWAAATGYARQGEDGDLKGYQHITNAIVGFDLSPSDAEIFARQYNAHCQPPFDESKLAEKVQRAIRDQGRVAADGRDYTRGYLLRRQPQAQPQAEQAQAPAQAAPEQAQTPAQAEQAQAPAQAAPEQAQTPAQAEQAPAPAQAEQAPAQAEQAPAQAEQAPATATGQTEPVCARCFTARAGDSTCRNCGATETLAMPVPPPLRLCSHCQTVTRAESCDGCGADMADGAVIADAGADAQGRRGPIAVRAGSEHVVADTAAEYLALSQAPVYQRAGALVDMVTVQDPSGGRGTPVIRDLPRGRLAYLVAERCKFERGAAEKVKSVDCPQTVLSMIESMGSWPGIRPLHSITEAPIVRADGSVRTTAGYDGRTRTYLARDVVSDEIPERPTAEQACAAARKLLSLLCDFPWADPARGRAVWLSSLLTRLTRGQYGCAPLFLARGNSPGCGKGTLIDLISLICDGTRPSPSQYEAAPERMADTIFSDLRQGRSVIVLDNIPERCSVDSAPLASVLTSERYSARVKGISESESPPNCATWFASGNGTVLSREIARRTLIMDLIVDSADDRDDFVHRNIHRHVREHRGEYLAAAITVYRAWAQAGRPQDSAAPVFRSYEDWSESVRQCVLWLIGQGMAGELADPYRVGESRETDEVMIHGRLAMALEREWGEDGGRITDLIRLDERGRLIRTDLTDLFGSLEEKFPSNPAYWAAKIIGQYDVKKRGKVRCADGKVRWIYRGNGNVWRVGSEARQGQEQGKAEGPVLTVLDGGRPRPARPAPAPARKSGPRQDLTPEALTGTLI